MAHRKYDDLPKPVMNMLLQGAWLVGSAAAWYVGDRILSPNDWDICVPPERYQACLRTLPDTTVFTLTPFGGARCSVMSRGGECSIDFWPMSLEEFTATTMKGMMGAQVAYRFDPATVVRWGSGVG